MIMKKRLKTGGFTDENQDYIYSTLKKCKLKCAEQERTIKVMAGVIRALLKKLDNNTSAETPKDFLTQELWHERKARGL